MSSIALTHLFFFGPLIALCFASFGVLKSAQPKMVPNQPSRATSERAPASLVREGDVGDP